MAIAYLGDFDSLQITERRCRENNPVTKRYSEYIVVHIISISARLVI